MAFTKKEDYPSVRKPGLYLEESDERLGLNTSDLDWHNSINKKVASNQKSFNF